MAELNGIDNIIAQYGKAKATTQGTTQSLGKNEFLKLLVAQLKNQDPLKPMDGTDFAAQLAQFSSLEQLNNLNEGIKNLGVYQMSQANAQAVNLIGKEVVISKGNTVHANGSPVDLTYELAGAAKTVDIKIYDAEGKLVDTVTTGDQAAGANKATWNGGINHNGTYTFQVTAKGADDRDVAATTLSSGKVTAVSFKNQSIYINVDGREIAFSDVREVKQA
ncbi:MAG TPA: flagellar hook capping FlgD N-terminal domain-containing protein [Syntrophales bacterium]|jgi:flagellar basal-body rod modification protein FlgD|nr:flagellar hook capping FlgD N-terminal domain-containing protein [Syntrophales bacterium]HON22748.1 flagellar hook capping FlgD N-terminal domain-containing protein [Syntrophales bacterium]HOU77071.1 flagellar hook capping FlgD N-terminal domain-containing protein [Syntrophales bacterium]HPC33129.1 flagellar hook capping FlgD N-terminal domain-containing protein [Syntrophales bacterium]HQI35589.1 flagellar hook capping FlgD N-terminal domain-containing protein [Syntrophales bacterium]